MNYQCEHIGLASSHPVRLREWYEHVLGARMVLQLADDPPAFLMELAGGTWIEIYQSDSSMRETGDNKLGGWRHLALKVPDLAAAKAELETLAVDFPESPKPAGGGGRVLFFRDPEGNLFHLVERQAPFSIS